MDRDSNAIAAAREYADAAWLATQDDDESLQERIDDRAAKIAAAIVASPERLAAMVDRGQICLHEMQVKQDGEVMSIERALVLLISASTRHPHVGLQHIASAIAEHLAGTTDVIEKAEVRLAEQGAEAEEASYET